MAEDGEKAEEGGGGGKEEESVKLFVGQVPKHMTEPDLLAMFRQVAAVDEVTVIKDKATRVSRGADPCARIWAGHHPPRLTRRNAGPLLPPPPAVLVLTHSLTAGVLFSLVRVCRGRNLTVSGVFAFRILPSPFLSPTLVGVDLLQCWCEISRRIPWV
jgi:hypothetical protein